ncbi:MAG: DUF1015 domain-containing protein [Clostridia bacterium]|nr:DUF1015 domain-containing protein [Clostridia bacterium]MBR5427807.1 DUF1015 domain-containing protein [Clostridia bacterium]
MAVLRPFCAGRPKKEYAADIAALPYDVMSSREAREVVKTSPLSFLRVDRAEIDLPEGTDAYSDAVYDRAAWNLHALFGDGYMFYDPAPRLYIYRQVMDGRTQTGIVGCVSIDDYMQGVIKKHELTRADKEVDRFRHVDTCDANTGPIFLTYRGNEEIDAVIGKYTSRKPEYDFVSGGVRNTVWVIGNQRDIARLRRLFGKVESLYIADGHHRAASAVAVGRKRREQTPDYTGEEEFNFFLAVLFRGEDLHIMDYNRVLADLNGLTLPQLLTRLRGHFTVTQSKTPVAPPRKHTFGMYTEGKWFLLEAHRELIHETDPVGRLDVSILQDSVIGPIFGVTDPRKDHRIDFVGGIRGLAELEKRADSDMKLAFSMFPTTVNDLMAIADAGLIMPPKSTWFEPKLLSGLFIHKLNKY